MAQGEWEGDVYKSCINAGKVDMQKADGWKGFCNRETQSPKKTRHAFVSDFSQPRKR